MKILIVPDKFKHTLTAFQVADTIQIALQNIYPYAEIIKLPAADGGEGTAEISAPYFNAKKINLSVKNPIFQPVNASYYFSEENKTALIDMSAASGLQLLKAKDRNPLHTSTYGTGEIICDAFDKGARTIYLALGGSATNDAGCGAAEAVGYKFYDKNNKQIKNIRGKNLTEITKIEGSEVKINFNKLQITALHDVSNPLYGKNGAAYVYAGQKGANSNEIKLLDKGLRNFAEIARKQFNITFDNCSGCGAAGGFGAGSKMFFNAELKSGAETVLQFSGFNKLIKNTNLIITGEGKFDKQSFDGKLTGTIIKKADENKIPVTVICGTNESEDSFTYKNLKILPLYKKFPGNEIAKKEAVQKIKEITVKSNLNFVL